MRVFEAVTEHTSPFKTLIEVLKEIVPETNIECRYDVRFKKAEKNKKGKSVSETEIEDDGGDSDEEESETPKKKDQSGLKIMAIDTTRTVLIYLKLDAKNFDKFKCSKKKQVFGVNFTSFYKCIKSMDKNDILTLYVEHDDKNSLRIKIDNPEENKKSIYKLKLLDLDNKKIPVPTIEFDAAITMSSQEFHKTCREMNQIADYVEIKCLKDKIYFTCKGDCAERETMYDSDTNSGAGVSIRRDNSGDGAQPPIVQGIYDLKNIVLFSKCQSLCNDIEIYMKNDYPLVIIYTVATLGRAILCLSPVTDDVTKNANFSDEDELYSDEEVEIIEKKGKGKK